MSDKEIKQETTESEDKKTVKPGLPELKVGMVIRVYQKIKELNIKGDEKERVQYFEGRVIAIKHGKEAGGTFTVRKVTDGVGVEKVYPFNLPTLEKIEIKKIAKVRRAKLFFLRDQKKKLKETVVKA